MIFACKLHAADLQHFRAETGELEHFFKADDVKLASFGLNARIGGIDAVYVREDEAFLGLKCHGKCYA